MMNKTAATIDGQLVALKSQLVPLQDSWQGGARDEYLNYQMMWNTAAEGLL